MFSHWSHFSVVFCKLFKSIENIWRQSISKKYGISSLRWRLLKGNDEMTQFWDFSRYKPWYEFCCYLHRNIRIPTHIPSLENCHKNLEGNGIYRWVKLLSVTFILEKCLKSKCGIYRRKDDRYEKMILGDQNGKKLSGEWQEYIKSYLPLILSAEIYFQYIVDKIHIILLRAPTKTCLVIKINYISCCGYLSF